MTDHTQPSMTELRSRESEFSFPLFFLVFGLTVTAIFLIAWEILG